MSYIVNHKRPDEFDFSLQLSFNRVHNKQINSSENSRDHRSDY